jgi:hypothetical protein
MLLPGCLPDIANSLWRYLCVVLVTHYIRTVGRRLRAFNHPSRRCKL